MPGGCTPGSWYYYYMIYSPVNTKMAACGKGKGRDPLHLSLQELSAMPSAAGSGAIPPRNQAHGHGKTLGVDPFRDGNSRNSRLTEVLQTRAKQQLVN